ncbi:hypothetical protein VZT92_006683 [Zoarces viviparus]|uniref:Uncharacterized protein n=1 Tax=Zoarces viviparus TaxID=48416 RepID=A0AAW1FQQ1_ZOAVI
MFGLFVGGERDDWLSARAAKSRWTTALTASSEQVIMCPCAQTSTSLSALLDSQSPACLFTLSAVKHSSPFSSVHPPDQLRNSLPPSCPSAIISSLETKFCNKAFNLSLC